MQDAGWMMQDGRCMMDGGIKRWTSR